MAVFELSDSLTGHSELAHPVCMPREDELAVFDGEAELTGWTSQLLEGVCGYAWYDRDDGRWYHTPPKVVREGGFTSCLLLRTYLH